MVSENYVTELLEVSENASKTLGEYNEQDRLYFIDKMIERGEALDKCINFIKDSRILVYDAYRELIEGNTDESVEEYITRLYKLYFGFVDEPSNT